MKKFKLGCVLLVAIVMVNLLLNLRTDSSKELLINNVEALTFDEVPTPDCIEAHGWCYAATSDFVRGLKYKW